MARKPAAVWPTTVRLPVTAAVRSGRPSGRRCRAGAGRWNVNSPDRPDSTAPGRLSRIRPGRQREEQEPGVVLEVIAGYVEEDVRRGLSRSCCR